MKIVTVSTFDGMSCGRLALDKVKNLKVLRYYSSEIKSHALKVSNENYPEDTKYRLGDITKIDGKKLRKKIRKKFGKNVKILLIGGSPCQDFSGANSNRLGVNGVKSGLFYEYVRLKQELKPDYFLLENVRMLKEHQDIVSNELGVEPIVIQSSKVVPQLRHRLYWCNWNVSDIPINEVKLNDILESGYSDRNKSRALLESESRPLSTPIKMVHRYFSTGFTTLIFKSKEHFEQVKKHYNKNFKGHTAKEIDVLIQNMDLSIYKGVRYMNSTEREICQGVPKGYTSKLNEKDSACLLGDGWTISVISHILKCM